MYDGIKLFLEWVGYFFIAYLIGYSTFLFLSVVVGSLELYKHRRQEMLKSILPSDYYLPISIIVPAYNEEVTVADTVRSLLALDYRSYEIIVVDDGSKDRTSEVLAETFDMHLVHRPIRRQINCQREEYVYETRAQKVPVTLIRKKNGGKADALNMGINAANFPYFICMDADSVLQYDSLRRIAQPILENGNVVAVGGIVRISNDVELENGRVKHYRLPRNILAFMQVLEYDRSFLASRILFDRFNGSLIISGAFGLFKKIPSSRQEAMTAERWARIWSLWSSCTNTARSTTSTMPFATHPTRSAGRRRPSGCAICASSASAGIWACSRVCTSVASCFPITGSAR